jgi:hypothetical protein
VIVGIVYIGGIDDYPFLYFLFIKENKKHKYHSTRKREEYNECKQ